MDDTAVSHNRVITDHETVKRWVRQRGGRPVARTAGGTEQLDLEFPGDEAGDVSPMDWSEFFAHFEVQGLALACSDESGPTESGIEYALVDRERDDLDVDDDAESAGEPKAARRDEPPERDLEDEGQAEERYHEAKSETNTDAHRDEPPFQS